MDEKTLRKLREKLDKALAANRNDEAIQLLASLVSAEPTNARWSHKRGDLLRRVGRNPEAVEAYTIAVDAYACTGFIARAVAMAKTVLSLDPARIDVLQRVDPNAAQQLHRQARRVSLLPASQLGAAGGHRATPPIDEPASAPGSAALRPPARTGSGPHAAPPPPAPIRPTAQGGGRPPLHNAAVRPRAAPPPPPLAAMHQKPATTLDRLSLPPLRPPAPPPPRASQPPAAAAAERMRGSPPPVPRPASGSIPDRRPLNPEPARPPVPAPPTAAASSVGPMPGDSDSAPLWAEHSPVGSLPAAPAHETARTRSALGPARYERPADEAELFSRALEAALELSIAPDVAPNETRFSNAPPHPGLSLSAAEVSPRIGVAPDESRDAVPPSAGQLSNLPLFPLFAEVPQDVLAVMIEGTELIELEDGAYVMRRGDPGDALYGIVDGSVAVVVPSQSVELTLAEGDVFGESCLLQDEPRHADVRVKGRLTALRIPRAVLHRMLRHYPPLAEVMLELLARRLLGNLLQTSPLFQEFDAEGRRVLSSLFEVRRAAEGTQLAIAGKRMDGLYISLTGTVLVESPRVEPWIAAPGSMFGQHTLLSEVPAPASVTARVNLIVLRLPSTAFSQLAMQYPTVIARLAELSTGDVVSVSL